MITKSILERILKKELSQISNTLKSNRNPNHTTLSILIALFITIFGGYIIFEVQKLDSIRIKKIESFEHIVESFNEISKMKFNNNSTALMSYLYNSIIEINTKLPSKSTSLEQKVLELKIQKLKLDYIQQTKEQETKVQSLIQSIHHHENLLKIYYGYSLDARILPIAKMLAILKLNQKLKTDLDNEFANTMSRFLEVIVHNQIAEIDEAKKIEETIKNMLNQFIVKLQSNLELSIKLHELFSEESRKLTDSIYSNYINELNTPIYKSFIYFKKNEFSSIIYDDKENLNYQLTEDSNGKYIFKK